MLSDQAAERLEQQLEAVRERLDSQQRLIDGIISRQQDLLRKWEQERWYEGRAQRTPDDI